MNLVETLLLSGIIASSFLFWALIFTKVEYVYGESKDIYFMILFIQACLYGSYIFISGWNWIEISNVLPLMSLFIQIKLIMHHFEKKRFIFLQISCIVLYFLILIFFQPNNALQMISLLNVSITISHLVWKIAHNYRHKKKQAQLSQTTRQTQEAMEKYLELNASFLEKFDKSQNQILRVILLENTDKWLHLPKPIQAMYLKSVIKKNLLLNS